MLLKKQLNNQHKYPQSSFEVENIKNAAFNANRDRILTEHSRTSSLIDFQQEKLQAVLLETQITRRECQRVTQGYDEAIRTIDQQFTELAVEEENRIQQQSFIDQFNAGKPIGFFKLPSMLTRIERPKRY